MEIAIFWIGVLMGLLFGGVIGIVITEPPTPPDFTKAVDGSQSRVVLYGNAKGERFYSWKMGGGVVTVPAQVKP